MRNFRVVAVYAPAVVPVSTQRSAGELTRILRAVAVDAPGIRLSMLSPLILILGQITSVIPMYARGREKKGGQKELGGGVSRSISPACVMYNFPIAYSYFVVMSIIKDVCQYTVGEDKSIITMGGF